MAQSLGNAVGLVGGISKYSEGRKMQKEAQRQIANFEWKDLENSYKNLQVSTLGADLQIEENNRANAGAVDALRTAGNRALVGGLGRVQANNNLVNRQIAADLDKQQQTIDYAAANDDSVIRQMIEKRQTDELSGYGKMLNTGMNMKYGGISDIMNGLQATGQTLAGGAFGNILGGGNNQNAVNTTDSINPNNTSNGFKIERSTGDFNSGFNLPQGGFGGLNNISGNIDYSKLYGNAFAGSNYGMSRNNDPNYGY